MLQRRGAQAAGVLALLLMAAAGTGLVEGVVDVRDVGAGAGVGRTLGYAMASWVIPAFVLCVPAMLLGLLAGRRRAAMWGAVRGGALGVGLLAGAVAWVASGGPGRGMALLVGGVATCLALWVLPWLATHGVRRLCVGGALVLLAAWVLATGWLRPTEHWSAAASAATPVVVIVADALRADALGCYGGAHSTPHIDRIGAAGWVVEDVLSTSSWTLPAMTSLWTGLEPALHGVRTSAAVLDDSLPVLAEHMGDHGYRTAGIISNPILDPDRGFGRGFDVLRTDTHQAEASFFWVGAFNRWALDRAAIRGPNAPRKLTLPRWPGAGATVRRTGYRAADEVTDDALELLDGLGESGFLLYVHYFDAHDPYMLHPGELLWDEPECTPENHARLEQHYAGEVAFLDEQVGRLLDGLENRGLMKRALVVFTADHGEEFLDHGGWRHGANLHDELVGLPLLVSFPGPGPPGPAPEQASLVDVAPTILAVVGLPPLPGARGRDLRKIDSNRPRFADRIGDGAWMVAVRHGGQHAILRLPAEHGPSPADVRRWIDRLDGDLQSVFRWEGQAGLRGLSVPRAMREQVQLKPAEAGTSGKTGAATDALVFASGPIPMPTVRTTPVVVTVSGLLAARLRSHRVGSPGRVRAFLEQRDGEGWSELPGSRAVIEHLAGVGVLQVPATRVAVGQEVRLAFGPVDSLQEKDEWWVEELIVAVDDPRLLFEVRLYDTQADPSQQHDLFPTAGEQWEVSLRLALEYLALQRPVVERPLEDVELDRLRAMGYLR